MDSTAGDGVVQVAYLHSENVSHSWVESMRGMWEHDSTLAYRRIARRPLNLRCMHHIAHSRNYAVKLFLEHTDHEWLFFVDTDMGFEPDAVHRLLEVAHIDERQYGVDIDEETGEVRLIMQARPVVGGLCFAYMIDGYDGMGGHRFTIVPTMYRIGETDKGEPAFCYFGDYTDNEVTQVAATGGAFLLIHRTVLEKLRAEHGDHWFDQFYDRAGDIVGEDIAFCGRVLNAGIIPVVHTGVKTTHHKEIWLSEADYMAQKMTTVTIADWEEDK